MDKRIDLADELYRTNPDYVVYVPSEDGSDTDWGNEHFLVFYGKDNQLMALWTQSMAEGQYNQRIMFTRTKNRGLSWQTPRMIAGGNADPKTGKGMCSWGFPVVTLSGRVYVFYSRHLGINDYATHTTGLLCCIYSDDNGASWSSETVIPQPRSKWDHPDASIPPNCIIWQKPLRFSNGKYLSGVTRWISPTRVVEQTGGLGGSFTHAGSVVEFIRFENIDDNPEPSDLRISWLTPDDRAVQVPNKHCPAVSLVQEASLVELPDHRIMAVMRTTTGMPWYVLSADFGESWSQPKPLIYNDGGLPFKHPLSPCPIYQTAPGEYVFFYHNHDGNFGPWADYHTCARRPIYMAKGVYCPEADQPVRFSVPMFWADDDTVALGHGEGRPDLSFYSSMTELRGDSVLWYPDRKFFLLGRKIDRNRMDNAVFPS